MEGVAGSAKLEMDSKRTMRRAEVTQGYAEEGNQLHRSGIGKGIVSSSGLKGMMSQAGVGTRWLAPLLSL